VSTPASKSEARIEPRNGLGGRGAKLSDEPLSIAYFGASVTAQRDGYRPRLHEGLRARFGQNHRSVFAGVGGIDIVSAAFLADEFVVRHRPDLCLIEFTSAELIRSSTITEAEAAMDGVVARLIGAGIRPCVVHLPRREWHGEHADLLGTFERVAERHGIPSIDLTAVFLDQVATTAEPLFRDLVHTTEAGAELAAELIADAIESIAAQDRPGEDGGETLNPVANPYRHAHVLPVAADHGAGAAEMGLFRLQLPYLELPLGSRIRRRLTEQLAGLLMVVGPESGELEIADSAGRQRLMAWDEFCHYERFTACVFDRPCEAGGEFSIELTSTVPDYASCRRPVEAPERRTAKVLSYMVLPA
jgi:hypothetical protein